MYMYVIHMYVYVTNDYVMAATPCRVQKVKWEMWERRDKRVKLEAP